jgi:CelD/BcsL family acetyltransferase involved in cellulose biosynthesis/glycosyltransferase involved in cell wall biosynthesis
MRLTVLSVAWPLAPVGVDAVGGAEQVLSALDEALVREGHRSVVLACEGSRCHGELRVTPLPPGPLEGSARAAAQARYREVLERLLSEERVDVVHLHGLDFNQYLPPPGPPVLVTLHLPPGWYAPEALRPSRPGTYLHCVSASQRRACPEGVPLLEDIPNGVCLEKLRPGPRKRGHALALGRVCPEKGFHLAMAAAHRARVPLLLGGQVFPYPEHLRYFEEQLLPLLDGQRRFLGPLGLERKRRLLASARCLVVPSLAPETSSLVAMEALACGTPVVAFRHGALSEIVEHGRTGLLVSGVEEMTEALREVEGLRPEDCRRAAEERFSSEGMVRRYLELYTRLCAPRQGAQARVEEVRGLSALEALQGEWRQLWERSRGASTFQRPEWLLPWSRYFGGGAVWALALRQGRQLVGLAALNERQESGRRVIGLAGGGLSDYQDVLVDEALAPGGAETLLNWLTRHRARWDAFDFEQLASGSPLLRARAPRGWRERTVVQEQCPQVELPGRVEELGQAVSTRLLSNLRQARRRLERRGPVRVEEATEETVETLLLELIRLHGARWRQRRQAGVLANEALHAFHREVARGLLGVGALRLYVLRVSEQPAAVFYGFRDGACMRYYLGGFDPAFERESAGSLVVLHALEEAVRTGARVFDFLRGQEAYKYTWGARDVPNHRRWLEAEEG